MTSINVYNIYGQIIVCLKNQILFDHLVGFFVIIIIFLKCKQFQWIKALFKLMNVSCSLVDVDFDKH